MALFRCVSEEKADRSTAVLLRLCFFFCTMFAVPQSLDTTVDHATQVGLNTAADMAAATSRLVHSAMPCTAVPWAQFKEGSCW